MARVRIQVEVTTRCNHSCSYCPRYVISETRTLGDIIAGTRDLLLSRLSEFDQGDKIMVSVSGFGEPTMYHDLMWFLCELKSVCNVVVRLNTNASFLHKVGSEIISSGCVDRLTVSLNLPTEELYIKHTGSTDFTTASRNIVNFLKEKGAQTPATEITLIRTSETAPHLEEATEHWRNHLNRNDKVSITELANWGGMVGKPQTPRTTPCRFQQDLAGKRLTIDKDGYVGVCCFSIAVDPTHPLIIGNIKDHSIDDLLVLAKLRAQSLIGSKTCENCNNDAFG